jgi:hypothetical protein
MICKNSVIRFPVALHNFYHPMSGGACVLAYREETGGKYMADHKAAMAKRFAHSGTFDGGRKQSAAPKHPDTR